MKKKVKEDTQEKQWLKGQVMDTLDNLVYDAIQLYQELSAKVVSPKEYDTKQADSLNQAKDDLLSMFKLEDPKGYWSGDKVKQELRKFNLRHKTFSKWMCGQTRPVLVDGTPGYYQWDVERYIAWKVKGTQPIFD